MVKRLIANVSTIFLLPVFEKSSFLMIFEQLRTVSAHGKVVYTVYCNAMVRNRTVDNSVTYWFPWKHHMVRRRGLEFGVFDEMPQKWARPFGPCCLTFLAPLHENTTQMWTRSCRPCLSSVENAPGANFSPFRCPPWRI